MKIRRAKISDVLGMYKMFKNSEWFYVDEKDIESWVGSSTVYIAEEKGIHGALVLAIYKSYIIIEAVIVSKRSQRRGVWTKLAEKMNEVAKNKVIKYIETYTERTNRPMQKALEKLGFKDGGLFKYYFWKTK